MSQQLIRTDRATIRLISMNEMDMIDIHLFIGKTFQFLNKSQRNDFTEGYKTIINDNQVKLITELV